MSQTKSVKFISKSQFGHWESSRFENSFIEIALSISFSIINYYCYWCCCVISNRNHTDTQREREKRLSHIYKFGCGGEHLEMQESQRFFGVLKPIGKSSAIWWNRNCWSFSFRYCYFMEVMIRCSSCTVPRFLTKLRFVIVIFQVSLATSFLFFF